MTKRIKNLHAFSNQMRWHPIGKLLKRMTTEERIACLDFIIENDTLSKDDFAFKANRWFLDNPNKPKHYTEMVDVVTQCNSED